MLREARRERFAVDPADKAPIPKNVEKIARQHVKYRLGVTPGPNPLDRHGVRTRDAVDMRERLTEFLEGTVDPTKLIRDVAGKKIAVFELCLAVTFFCQDHKLAGQEGEILSIVVPENQLDRLERILGKIEGN
jgi:hypothetical protein